MSADAELLRRTLDAIHRNAQAWHVDEAGKERALNVIAEWAQDALDGRLNPSVEKVTQFPECCTPDAPDEVCARCPEGGL